MKDWLKFYFGSFFNNKLAREAEERSGWNCALSYFVAVILMLLVLVGSVLACFPSHYNRSDDFKGVLNGVFGDGEYSVEFAVKDRHGVSNAVINTFLSDEDKAKYGINGYNVILDARDIYTNYNDFSLTVKKANSQEEISYDAFRSLSSDEKKNYQIAITFGDNALEYTPERIQIYREFLSQQNGEVLTEYNKLLVDGEVPFENHVKLYELYFKNYYTELVGYDNFGVAPTMRTYYINKYLAPDANGEAYRNYIVVLQDIVFASWYTDDGVLQSISGYYPAADVMLNKATPEQIAMFMVNTFNTNSNIIMLNYMVNMFTGAIIMLAVWFGLALITSLIGKFAKQERLVGFGAMTKVVGTFQFMSLVFAAVVAFVLSFFTSKSVFYIVAIATYGACMLVRTVVYAALINRIKDDDDDEDEPASKDGDAVEVVTSNS